MSTTNPIRDEISKAISAHEVILFMKGRPEQPMCGFSARTVAALDALGASYAAVDILPDPRIRQELSAISNWPTIPQLFVNGESSAAATSSPRCTRPASSPRRWHPPPADAPEDAPVAAEPGASPLQIKNNLV